MKFEIPFNEMIFIDQTNLIFKNHWSKNLKKNRKRLFVGIPMILLGSFIIYLKSNLGYLYLVIGLHFLINFFEYYSYYKKNKKAFYEIINSEIEGQNNSKQDCIWQFNDDYFFYKDFKYETKIMWKTFKSYRVIENNLFLDINVGNNSSYIIGESEIGNENFLKLTEFIKNKIIH